jgi:hypothetical protein
LRVSPNGIILFPEAMMKTKQPKSTAPKEPVRLPTDVEGIMWGGLYYTIGIMTLLIFLKLA